MRILIVTEALTAGGAETFALRLTRKLRQLGAECDLLCLNRDLVVPELVRQYPDVPLITVPVPAIRWIKRADRLLRLAGGRSSLQRWWTGRWIASTLLDRYDVVHTHLLGADRLFAALKRHRPTFRLVSTLHGDYALHESRCPDGRRLRGWRATVNGIVRAVDRWVYIAEDQRRLFAQGYAVSGERLVRIYNGYEPPQPLPPAERKGPAPLTFVMAARALPDKGWGELLEAFTHLKGDCRLLLVGSGPYLDDVRRRYGHESGITFLGFHPNPAEVMQGADVFVFPSTYKAESLPTVIIEALYCGLPVIATDVGEVAAMIRTPAGEVAGSLLEVSSRPTLVRSLAGAMQRYLDDPALVSTARPLARAAFAKFDMERCARAYLAVYADLAGRTAAQDWQDALPGSSSG